MIADGRPSVILAWSVALLGVWPALGLHTDGPADLYYGHATVDGKYMVRVY